MNVLRAASISFLIFTFAQICFSDELDPVMHKNFQALVHLQPYAASADAFADPKNLEEIQKYLDQLGDVGDQLPKMVSKNKPSLVPISKVFGSYMKDMQRNYKTGNREFVRRQVRTVTGFCMECHTRTQKTQSFVIPDTLLTKTKLTPFEKAEFLAATRQFDQALVAFENVVLQNPEMADHRFIEAARAIKNYLSLSVRVKQNPSLTYAFLNKISKAGNIASFFARDLEMWKKDASTWMKEKPLSGKVTADVLLSRAKKLIDSAKKNQAFPADHSGDIQFLRATNFLHVLLEGDPKGKYRAEAFYLLGVAYDALNDPLLWELDGLYFEACIRDTPHTPLSKKCFKQYASGIYLGYSGSGGTHIPQNEVIKLGELKKLAD